MLSRTMYEWRIFLILTTLRQMETKMLAALTKSDSQDALQTDGTHILHQRTYT